MLQRIVKLTRHCGVRDASHHALRKRRCVATTRQHLKTVASRVKLAERGLWQLRDVRVDEFHCARGGSDDECVFML